MAHAGAVTAGLAWAVPVDPLELIVHLASYVESRPSILMLRLCARFGRGPKAYVAKLPLEIVAMTERLIIQGSIQTSANTYLEDVRNCGDRVCQPLDHLTPSRKAAILKEALDDDGCDLDWEDEEELENNREEYLTSRQLNAGEGLHRHFQQAELWEEMIKRELSCSSADCLCFSVKYDKVLESDFGLEAHIVQRMDENLPAPADFIMGSCIGRKTLAYLIFSFEFVRDYLDVDEEEVERNGGELFEVKTTANIRIHPTLMNRFVNLSIAQLGNFRKALNVLELEPFDEDNSAGLVSCTTRKAVFPNPDDGYSSTVTTIEASTDLSSDDEVQGKISQITAERKAKQTWPQLMLFADTKFTFCR